MKQRWLITGGLVAAGAVAYFALRSGDGGTAAAPDHRTGKVNLPAVREAKVEARDPFAPAAPQKRKPRTWVDPVSGAINREVMDAVPDPEAAAREELTFRLRRLRLSASDAAAPCWTGGDSKEEITINYSLVIKKEALHAEKVTAAENSISDPAVTACILSSVRDMTSIVDNVPDMTESYTLTMSLHDLYVRNRGASDQPAKAANDDFKSGASK